MRLVRGRSGPVGLWLALATMVGVVVGACAGAGPASTAPAASPGTSASVTDASASPSAPTSASTSGPTAPGSATASAATASPVEGIVLTIDSSGLTKVRGFTLRATDGRVFTFTIGQLDNPTQFPPGHLGEHQASAEPVRVWFRTEGGSLVVYRLEDASG